MDLLWPDEAIERSAPLDSTRPPTSRGKATAWDDAVVLRGDEVWMFPGATVVVDVVRFEELARRAGTENDPVAADALAVYGGELLPSDRYEDWAVARRELLALRRLDVLRVAGGMAGRGRALPDRRRGPHPAHAPAPGRR